MAKEQNSEDLARSLKERGLTCKRLEAMEKKQKKDAQDFRKVGFNQIANAEETIVKKIKGR